MDLSPLPILDAAENYRGEFVDLHAGQVLTTAGFQAARVELARKLADAGIRRGDRVIVAVANGPEFVVTLLAILAEGSSPLLVHPKAPAAELKRIALRYGSPWIISNECPAEDLQSIEVVPSSVEVRGLGGLTTSRLNSASPGFDSNFLELPGVPLHPTSGTTGEPKIAVRPGRAATEEARHYIETIGVTTDDTIVAVAPMCHAYAYGMCVMVPLLSSARVVSMRSFQASRVFQALAQEGVTIFPAVPAMLEVLMFGAGDRLRGAVRTVLSAGSPLSERTASRFRAKSGITIRPLYGTTETGGITVAPAGEEQVAGGCVGPAMLGVETQVRPHPHTTEAPPGVGQLHVRSSSMMAGYLGRDTIETGFLPDGWFATGDLAWMDQAGRIHLMGREADVINVEGLKVIPSEVEEVIAALAGVVEVKVYAGRRLSGGQFIKAAVVLEGEVDESAIRAHCEKHLVYYKRPERILPVERLPRSPAGKILRDQLP